jgi:hypothetical protein
MLATQTTESLGRGIGTFLMGTTNFGFFETKV